MSCKLVTGEPGAGKSLYITRELIDHVITRSTMPIVTNMPLKLDPWMLGSKPQKGLRAYLEEKYDDTFDIDSRIRFLDDEQCSEFYTHRGSGIDVAIQRDDKGNPTELDIEAASSGGGVCYVIDECWKFFGARDWQTTGKALTFYGKQHRKLGDEIWLATHDFKDVDTAIRRIVEQTIVMRNHGRMRIGAFRQPKYFTAEHFARVPSGVQSPMHTDRFTLDVAGLCQCYDTSAGVGLKGGKGADTKAKPRGLHFGFLIALVVLLCIAATRIPWLMGRLVGAATLSGSKSAVEVAHLGSLTNSVKSTNIVAAPVAAQQYAPLRERSQPVQAEFREGIKPLPENREVSITGLVRSPTTGEVRIYLSDGNSYSVTDREVGLVTERYAVIEGRVYRWPKLPSGPKEVTQRNFPTFAPPPVVVTPGFTPHFQVPKPGLVDNGRPLQGGL